MRGQQRGHDAELIVADDHARAEPNRGFRNSTSCSVDRAAVSTGAYASSTKQSRKLAPRSWVSLNETPENSQPAVNRIEPRRHDLQGPAWSGLRRHYSDSAFTAISARSLARAFRVTFMPSLPKSAIMILLTAVGRRTSAPNVSVRSVPPSRSARVKREV